MKRSTYGQRTAK